METFDKYQSAQINLAEQHGVPDTICRDHPEWGPTFMNICWNRERDGRGLASVLKAARFLGTRFPKENGKIHDGLEDICYILGCYDSGREPVEPDGRGPAGYAYLRVQDKALDDGAVVLDSGRVSVGKTNLWDLPVLMAEGDGGALAILRQLESFSAAAKHTGSRPFDMMSVLLALDDMNIRGKQVTYALDYAGGSIQVLYGHVHGRSADLCRYVNSRTASAFVETGSCQVAVSSGASFQYPGSGRQGEVFLSMHNPASYVSDVGPVEPDYASLDVLDGVGLDEAVRVITAHGFREIRSFDKLPRIPDWPDDDGPCKYKLFYNPDTGDYMVVRSGKPSNACYGGVSLYMHRASDMPSGHCSNGPHDGQPGRYYEYTHHDGLFREWDGTGRYIPEGGYDWGLIGFGLFGIPVPEYFTLPSVRNEEVFGALSDRPRLADAMVGHGSIYFTMLVNCVLCLYDGVLMSSEHDPKYRDLYRDWFLDDGLFYAMGWYGTMSNVSELVCGEALSWLRVPPDVFRGWVARGPRRGWQGDGFEVVSRLEDRLRDGTPCSVSDAYKLPDPRELPVKLPWLE